MSRGLKIVIGIRGKNTPTPLLRMKEMASNITSRRIYN